MITKHINFAHLLATFAGELIDALPHICRLNSSPVKPLFFSAFNVTRPTLLKQGKYLI